MSYIGLFLLLSLAPASFALAEGSKPSPEPSLWEKAKKMGNEVWPGKAKPATSQGEDEGTMPVKKTGREDEIESKAQPETLNETRAEVRDSLQNRADSNLSLFYIPMSLGYVLPSKKGFAASWIINSKLMIEGEYLSGSYGLSLSLIDVALFSEKIYSGKFRWYPGNSFNVFAGLGQRNYKFTLGSDLLAIATDQMVTAFPTTVVENQVLVVGLGNRWQFDNGFTLGFDWFELIVPIGRGKVDDEALAYFANEKDKEITKKALRFFRYAPTINALKLQLGYTF